MERKLTQSLSSRLCLVKRIKLIRVTITVPVVVWLGILGQFLAAWNVFIWNDASLHREDTWEYQSAVCLIRNFLLDPPTPPPTTSCVFLVCHKFELVPMFLSTSKPPNLVLQFCTKTVEMSIIVFFYGLWWILCSKRKNQSDTASLFSHIKTGFFTDQTFHHVRRCEWTNTTEHVRTPSFFSFFFPPQRRSGANIPSPCTTVQFVTPLCCVHSSQSLVLLGAQAGMEAERRSRVSLF